MKVLRGTTDYKIIGFKIDEKKSDLNTCKITTLSKYFYNFFNETGKMKLIIDNNVKFIGYIDKLDYNFNDGTLSLSLTEYVNKLKYTEDLFGSAPTYEFEYIDTAAPTIMADILSGTEFSIGYCPNQTIETISGNKLDKIEVLKLLNNNIECGLDADGNYTTNKSNIVSDTRTPDIIVDYKEMKVYIGLKGCYKLSPDSEVFTQFKINIDDYIIDIDELQEDIRKVKRVIVIGKDDVYGSAYITSATDVPVKVINDNSCEDTASCSKRAEDELNTIYKQSSIGIKIQPEKYYDNSVMLGMKVILTSPKEIANEYTISEISANYGSVSVTLGRPKERLLTSLTKMSDRIHKLERW